MIRAEFNPVDIIAGVRQRLAENTRSMAANRTQKEDVAGIRRLAKVVFMFRRSEAQGYESCTTGMAKYGVNLFSSLQYLSALERGE